MSRIRWGTARLCQSLPLPHPVTRRPSGLRGRCLERGLDKIVLYVGGNLVIGKRDFTEVEALFKGMGYDRVFPPTVDLKQMAELLKQDVAARS